VRFLITGTNGQVGWELARTLAPLGEVVACDRSRLDLSDADGIVSAVRATRPTVIVNAAAYTAVDQAETDPAQAFAVNAVAPGVLAEETKRAGGLLVHYSTDYVFDGTADRPYVETDAPNPLGVYGRSKLEGERAIQSSGCRHLVFRTSWIYGPRGRNFLLTILRLARERDELRVVDDQVGAPTSAAAIAEATARVLAARADAEGLFHLTAAGQTSWYGFATAILRRAGLARKIVPITSDQYPTAARRPGNSVLSNERMVAAFGFRPLAWETLLDACMQRVAF
jgi:dTDP-4-dehydrorhamnose reductase